VAEQLVRELFENAGWQVSEPSDSTRGRAGLVVSRGDTRYVVEVKYASEGRSDRLIPLWAQACLQASRFAGTAETAVAVVVAPKIHPRLAEQVLEFAADHAPEVAAGVLDFAGLRMFRGGGLDALATAPSEQRSTGRAPGASPTDLFSDLNQWMLKVLLAPEIPEPLLTAPRGRYRNSSQLAAAAAVSPMSASRFVRELRHEGFLSSAGRYLDLVRREEIFQRWQLAASRRVREAAFVFLLRGDPESDLAGLLLEGRSCLALFAAAASLGLGFVTGVPPHVYVDRLDADTSAAWPNVALAEPGEAADFIVRQAPARNAIFRGAVKQPNGVLASDVLQVWLDVASHPTRGKEQADLIRRRVLERVITGREASS